MIMAEQFWATVDKSGDCWIWQGPRNPEGYGRRAHVYAHRLAYELSKGEIPEKFVIDHLCCNPPCVNPDHLEAVTHGENLRRGRQRSPQILCKRGHDLNAWGRMTKDGRRDCRLCQKERRKNPTPEQRELARQRGRRYSARKWAAMTPEQRVARAASRRAERARAKAETPT